MTLQLAERAKAALILAIKKAGTYSFLYLRDILEQAAFTQREIDEVLSNNVPTTEIAWDALLGPVFREAGCRPYVSVFIKYEPLGPRFEPDVLFGANAIGDGGTPSLFRTLEGHNQTQAIDFRFRSTCFEEIGGAITTDALVSISEMFQAYDIAMQQLIGTQELRLELLAEVLGALAELLNEVTYKHYFSNYSLLTKAEHLTHGVYKTEKQLDEFADFWCTLIVPAMEDLNEFMGKYRLAESLWA